MTASASPTLAPTTASPARPAQYLLPVARDRVGLARGWLLLALFSLVGSGLFSVLLVLARTPGVNRFLPGGDFFRTALVVHVDLSVLIWFVSAAGLLWSATRHRRRRALLSSDHWALALVGGGTACMVLAPFLDPGTPVMANYVPVLESRLFLAGLVAVAAGAGLIVLSKLASGPGFGTTLDGAGALRFGLWAAAACAAVALLAFGASLVLLPRGTDNPLYWEQLFWGGGHALQFTWTLLMLVAWLWLAQACGAQPPLSARVTLLLFAIALAAVLVTPYAYLAHEVSSVEHRELHTWGMRAGGGLAILPIALAVLLALVTHRELPEQARPLRAALLMSMGLFAVGGLIGLTIDGNNVKIPAHYHGSIVGVTLALMGLIYHLLPSLGYGAPRGRLAVLQPWCYGLGQLMHIVGLVWSGGYGVQRKVAGAEQVLHTPQEIFGMAVMGVGGLLAIAGGLLFVLVVWRAMRSGEGGA